MAPTIGQKSHCNLLYTITFTTQSEMANFDAIDMTEWLFCNVINLSSVKLTVF